MVEGLDSLRKTAEYLGVPAQTLYSWRSRGKGPKGYRVGRHIKFRRAEVDAWLESQADDGPSPAA